MALNTPTEEAIRAALEADLADRAQEKARAYMKAAEGWYQLAKAEADRATGATTGDPQDGPIRVTWGEGVVEKPLVFPSTIALVDGLEDALTQKAGRLVFNVKEFGANGNAEADDIDAIDAALAAAVSAGGGDVFFPEGLYLTSRPIGNGVAGYTNIHIYGAGHHATRIKTFAATPVIDGAWYHSAITNLVLDADLRGAACLSAHLDKTFVDDLQLYGWTGYGMRLNDGTFGDLGLLNRIQRCNIDQNTGIGIWTSYRFIDSWITSNNIGSSLANLSLEGGPLRVLDNHLDGSPEVNIELRGNKRITIVANILEGSKKQSIVYTMPPWMPGHDDPQIQIAGNAFSNGGKGQPGAYSAIEILGLSDTKRARGFSITGNIFACEDAGSGWEHAVKGVYGSVISVVGNIWPTGHTAASPVDLETSTAYEVVGNHGDNGPGNGSGGPQGPVAISDVTGLVEALAAKGSDVDVTWLEENVELWGNKTNDAALSDSVIQYPTASAVKRHVAAMLLDRVQLGPDGKIPGAFLPPMFIMDIFPVTSQAEMLAAPADKGDVAIRSDVNRTFILRQMPATTLENWSEILTPADGVLTVNGRSGPNVAGLAEQSALDALAAAAATKVYVDSQNLNVGLRSSAAITSGGGIVPDPVGFYEYDIQGLSSSFTISNPVATVNGLTMQILLRDDGTTRALTWGSLYHGTTAALPATTPTGKVLVLVFRYSAARARWELTNSRQEL